MCLLLLGLYLAFRAPIKDWGDLSQELMFHQVRKYLLLIDETKQHSKFWKPNMLVIHESMQPELAAFTNKLKKGETLVFGVYAEYHLSDYSSASVFVCLYPCHRSDPGGLLVFGRVVQGQLDKQKAEADHIRAELSTLSRPVASR